MAPLHGSLTEADLGRWWEELEMTDSESPEARQLKEKIERWLRSDYDTVEAIHPASMLWAFKATAKAGGRQIVVGQLLDDDAAILINSGIKLTQSIREKLGQRTKEERRNFSLDLALDLLKLDVVIQSDISDPLEQVSVGSRIFLDGLTRDTFEQRSVRVWNAIIAVRLHLARAIGTPINSSIMWELVN
jgi:hypothetical protein